MWSLYLQAVASNLVNKGGLSSGDVAAQYKHKNAVVDVKLDTESNVVANPIFILEIWIQFNFLLIFVYVLSRSWQPSLSQIYFHLQKLWLHLNCLILTLERYWLTYLVSLNNKCSHKDFWHYNLSFAVRGSVFPWTCSSDYSCWAEEIPSCWFFFNHWYSQHCFWCRGKLHHISWWIYKVYGWSKHYKARFQCFSNPVSFTAFISCLFSHILTAIYFHCIVK